MFPILIALVPRGGGVCCPVSEKLKLTIETRLEVSVIQVAPDRTSGVSGLYGSLVDTDIITSTTRTAPDDAHNLALVERAASVPEFEGQNCLKRN